ncbi:hypothetical protein SRHO_G00183080 [Serrasalmus rhombeus]
MCFVLKARILAIWMLTATLSSSLIAFGLAADGDLSVEELAELNLENQAGSKGEGTVYLEIRGVEDAGGSAGSSLRHRPQTDASSPSAETTQSVWTTRAENASLEEPSLPQMVFSSEVWSQRNTSSQKNRTLGRSLKAPEKVRPQQGAVALDGSEGKKEDGKLNDPSFITQEWLKMRPLVRCSRDAMTLTATGRGYTHFLVDRVDATPVSVLHLPPNCGFSLKTSGRHMELTALFDGCYVLQENGSYVLPLLWWGKPVKIHCPMSSFHQGTPSGFCLTFGMVIKMKHAQGAIEDHKVQVNGEWLPLLSDACACRMESPFEELVLFIPFTAPCARDGGSTLNVLLNGKEFTLSCLPPLHLPHYPSAEFFQPLHPGQTETRFTPSGPNPPFSSLLMKRETPEPHVVPHQLYPQPYIPHLSPGFFLVKYPNTHVMGPDFAFGMPIMRQPYGFTDPVLPFPQAAPPVDAPGTPMYQYSLIPLYHEPNMPGTATTSPKATIPLFPSSVGHNPMMPMMYSHHNHKLYPMHLYLNPAYHPFSQSEPVLPSPVPKFTTTAAISVPKHISKHPVVPTPLEHKVPQLPSRVPELPAASSKMVPSLTCIGNRLAAALPSAKMESVKVKDAKRNMWVPVSSAPARCGYSLQRKGRGVVLSSPLPACHSRNLSSSLFSLSLKFWDIIQLKHRVLQLRCLTTEPQESPPTTAESFTPWTWDTASTVPKPKQSFSQAKPVTSPSQLQKPTLFPSPKPTASSKPFVPRILCRSQHMSIILSSRAVTGLTVQAPSGGKGENMKAVPIDKAPHHCGYLVKEDQHGFITIFLPYKSCHMIYQDGQYQIMLKYQSADGLGVEALLSCQVPTGYECSLPVQLQLACGPSSVSAVECHGLGCCYSSDTAFCYYPMDECTADRHFVFSIPASLTDPPLSPALLVAAGNSSCTPQRVVADSALFKVPLDGCGAHRYEVGKTVIYMLEILNMVQSLSLNHGTITRDSPFRLLVECRYLPGTLASVSYLVKSPSLGPSIQAQGVFGVQLRIAEDQYYSRYYPQYHRPLQKLLGKPLYLEVRLLNPPDPSVVLLVHYCVAYPRSAQSAWVLIYDGCPNPLDVTPTHEPPAPPPEAVASHVRRFTVSTFQFLESSRGLLEPDEEEKEEIYFMCATEVCLPSEGQCIEGCFDYEDAPAVKS